MSELNFAEKAIASVSSGSGIMTTVVGEDFASKKITLAAITNAVPISEHLNETIELENVVMQAVSVVDDDGIENDAVRVILLDKSGSSYAALSAGLVGSLRDLFGILGQPSTWTEPVSVRVVENKSRRGFRFMKIELV